MIAWQGIRVGNPEIVDKCLGCCTKPQLYIIDTIHVYINL